MEQNETKATKRQMAIKRGDRVRTTLTDHASTGQVGTVMEVLKADRYFERRARVMFSSAYTTTLALKFLEEVE